MSNEERRNSYRFPLREELREAVIEARSQRLAVELIDQSAEGFSIKAARGIDIALDEVLVIETWAGRCQAIVARLVDCPDYRRVGLRRVTDITACSKRSRSLVGWLKERLPRRQAEHVQKNLAWVIAPVVATSLVAAGWIFRTAASPATFFNERLSSSATAEDAAPGSDRAIESADDIGSVLQFSSLSKSPVSGVAPGPASQAQSASTQNGPPPAAIDAKSTAANSEVPPRATLERLAALRSPKVANDLALSEHQKLVISRLLKKVLGEVSRARARMGEKNLAARDALVNSILVDAEAQAKAILNPDQQARWQSE